MGRKGVSKRKPKTKSKLVSKDNISGSSNFRASGNSLVQSLVKNTGATLKSGGMKPLAGSNKKQKKH